MPLDPAMAGRREWTRSLVVKASGRAAARSDPPARGTHARTWPLQGRGCCDDVGGIHGSGVCGSGDRMRTLESGRD